MGLTIALNRGRLLKEMLPMLEAIDMAPAEDTESEVVEATAGAEGGEE